MAKKSKLIKKIEFWLTVVIGGWAIRWVYFTNHFKAQGAHYYQDALNKGQSVILAIWHGRLLGPFMYLAGNEFYGLAGTHKDAELISRIGKKIGWRFVRGSSTERGREAYLDMLRKLKSPATLVYITPDGPKGPAKQCKPGVIRAAQATGSVIVPVACHSTKFRGFTNWDTFVVAKAFARTEIIFGPPLNFTDDMDYTARADLLTTELNKLEKQVDERTGH